MDVARESTTLGSGRFAGLPAEGPVAQARALAPRPEALQTVVQSRPDGEIVVSLAIPLREESR
jgi:hypothetical protein